MTDLPDLPPAHVDEAALLAWLDACGFDTVTTRHEALFTVEQSQKLRGDLEGGHTKNLFLKDRKGNYFLLTAQEDSEVPLKVLHRMIGGQGKFSFGSAEMMQALLGVTPGAVTALGVINDRDGRLRFAIDKRLLEHEKINCHPLTNEATTTIARDDLMAFFKATDHEPLIVDLNDVPPPAN